MADETSKVIADNPLAYEYDTLYDDMKAEEEQIRNTKALIKKGGDKEVNRLIKLL